MKTYDELLAAIEAAGTHAVFGIPGNGYGIEANPHELATFLVAMQELGVESALEIGTDYSAGLARFLAEEMGWQVTSVDVHGYGHEVGGVHFHDEETFDHAYERYDLVILKATPHYNDAVDQYADYAPQADKAVALFNITGERDWDGVARLWSEGEGDKHEAIATSKQGVKAGIGWLVLSEASEPEAAVVQNVTVPAENKSVVKPATKKPAAKPTATKKPTAKK